MDSSVRCQDGYGYNFHRVDDDENDNNHEDDGTGDIDGNGDSDDSTCDGDTIDGKDMEMKS